MSIDGSIRGRTPAWCCGAAALVAGAVLGVGGARAQQGAARPVSVRLEWSEGACGDASALRTRVLSRTQRVRFVGAEADVVARSSIRSEPGAWVAKIRLERSGEPPLEREFPSTDCADALDALALVMAVTLDSWAQTPTPAGSRSVRKPRRPARSAKPEARPDAEAESESPKPVDGPASAPPQQPPAATPPLDEPAPALDTPPEPAAASGQPTAADAAAEAAPAAHDDKLLWALGASARLRAGVVGAPLVGGQVWVEARWQRGSIWSPAIRLGLGHERGGGFVTAGGQAVFALDLLELALCPVAWPDSSLQLRGCVTAAGGRFHAEGQRTFDRRLWSRDWAALGAGVELVWEVAAFELRLGSGVSHPLVRDAFGFGPETCEQAYCVAEPVRRVGLANWQASLGMGWGWGD